MADEPEPAEPAATPLAEGALPKLGPEPEPEPEPAAKRVDYVWDPILAAAEPATRQCLKRIKKDLKDLFKDPLEGVCVTFDSMDITRLHALVTGPSDTPCDRS